MNIYYYWLGFSKFAKKKFEVNLFILFCFSALEKPGNPDSHGSRTSEILNEKIFSSRKIISVTNCG